MKVSLKPLLLALSILWLPLSLLAQERDIVGPFPLDEPVQIFLKHEVPRHTSLNGIIKNVKDGWIEIELIEYAAQSKGGVLSRSRNRRIGWIAIDSIALVKRDAIESAEELEDLGIDPQELRRGMTPDSNKTREVTR